MNCLECSNYWSNKVDQTKCAECVAERNKKKGESK